MGLACSESIEVASVRGDVIDHNAMTTTVLEIGPNKGIQQLTGRAVVLPNSVFLGKPLINESFTHDFVLHSFKVPVKLDSSWMLAEQDLLEAARQECSGFLEEARGHFSRFTKREGLESVGVDPRVAVSIPKAGELELLVRVAVPARRKGRVEQAILRRFLALVAARTAEHKPENAGGQPTDATGHSPEHASTIAGRGAVDAGPNAEVAKSGN
jgi:small-conductance mechanosensitive channel